LAFVLDLGICSACLGYGVWLMKQLDWMTLALPLAVSAGLTQPGAAGEKRED
jgi:hypothetical protein